MYIVVLDKMEPTYYDRLLFYTLHFIFYILTIPFYQDQQYVYVILARYEELPEDDVLISKHVGTNHM